MKVRLGGMVADGEVIKTSRGLYGIPKLEEPVTFVTRYLKGAERPAISD